MINRRFHKCLNEESKNKEKMEDYLNMTDYELVHNVCRRERLTLFNFLKMHKSDQHRTALSKAEEDLGGMVELTLNEERIKNLIHKEYHFYFREI